MRRPSARRSASTFAAKSRHPRIASAGSARKVRSLAGKRTEPGLRRQARTREPAAADARLAQTPRAPLGARRGAERDGRIERGRPMALHPRMQTVDQQVERERGADSDEGTEDLARPRDAADGQGRDQGIGEQGLAEEELRQGASARTRRAPTRPNCLAKVSQWCWAFHGTFRPKTTRAMAAASHGPGRRSARARPALASSQSSTPGRQEQGGVFREHGEARRQRPPPATRPRAPPRAGLRAHQSVERPEEARRRVGDGQHAARGRRAGWRCTRRRRARPCALGRASRRARSTTSQVVSAAAPGTARGARPAGVSPASQRARPRSTRRSSAGGRSSRAAGASAQRR